MTITCALSARRGSRCAGPRPRPTLSRARGIWPTDSAPVIRQTDDGHELIQLRWGFPPAKPKGRRSSIFARRNGAFRLGAAWCRPQRRTAHFDLLDRAGQAWQPVRFPGNAATDFLAVVGAIWSYPQ